MLRHSHHHAVRPARFRLEFAAFCEANRDAYVRYAQVRIDDQAEARRCVDAVLDALGARWVAVLGGERPAACAWRDLRTETAQRTACAAGRAGRFHAFLREDQADMMLLHYHLRLPIDGAAGLMGLADHEARALLRGAERDLRTLLGNCGA
ncbi:hypothetical protein [Streptomyces sp. NPDC050856]|uniref:hypothetical protein n=1 Tax=Streptomyces sp. NPDC050856 TaxID=3154939 RepID=UPI0033F0152F